MNYTETEMPSQNGSNPVKTGPLSESIELIRSFALLEEDEDLTPVPQREIERFISIIEAVYAKFETDTILCCSHANWWCWCGV